MSYRVVAQQINRGVEGTLVEGPLTDDQVASLGGQLADLVAAGLVVDDAAKGKEKTP